MTSNKKKVQNAVIGSLECLSFGAQAIVRRKMKVCNTAPRRHESDDKQALPDNHHHFKAQYCPILMLSFIDL